MTTFASLTTVYREERWIAPFLDGVRSLDANLVLYSTRSYQGHEDPPDGSPEIAEEHGAEVIRGIWPSEMMQRNLGLTVLREYDWVFLLDTDEHLTAENLGRLKEQCERADRPVIGTGGMRFYFGDFNHWLAASSRLRSRATVPSVGPHIAVDPKRATCIGGRICGMPDEVTYGLVPIEHFSYVRTDAEMYRKLHNFGHAPDFDVDKWIAEIWDHRHAGSTNLHPTIPAMWPFLVHEPAPAEITSRFTILPYDEPLPAVCRVCGPECVMVDRP